jgi:hypothetical protein
MSAVADIIDRAIEEYRIDMMLEECLMETEAPQDVYITTVDVGVGKFRIYEPVFEVADIGGVEEFPDFPIDVDLSSV